MIPDNWKSMKFTDVFKDVSSGNTKTQKGDYLEEGEYPIVDQGKSTIGGFSNDPEILCDISLPAIIFGDHTRIIKFIDFPFGMGADGVKVLKPKVDADAKYLFYYLQNLQIPDTGYNRHYKYLKRSEVILPPLGEQRRIAAVLDKADALRQKRRAALARLDTLLQATFLHMFGDPVTNPMGWETYSIKDLVIDGPQNGLYRPSSDYGSGNPIIRIDSFYNGKVIGLEKLKRVRIEPDIIEKYSVYENDILINRVNSREYLGKSAIVPKLVEPTVFESNMMRMTIDKNLILPDFLVAQMQHEYIKMQILSRCKDAVNQSSINQGDVLSFELRVPPLQKQKSFISAIKKLEKNQSGYLLSAAALDNLFHALQQRAFSGQL